MNEFQFEFYLLDERPDSNNMGKRFIQIVSISAFSTFSPIGITCRL